MLRERTYCRRCVQIGGSSDDGCGAVTTTDAIHLIDAILALVGLEFIAVVVIKRFRGSGPPLHHLAATLAAGALLLCATRAVLAGDTGFMLAALAAAGVTHGIDMALRWQ